MLSNPLHRFSPYQALAPPGLMPPAATDAAVLPLPAHAHAHAAPPPPPPQQQPLHQHPHHHDGSTASLDSLGGYHLHSQPQYAAAAANMMHHGLGELPPPIPSPGMHVPSKSPPTSYPGKPRYQPYAQPQQQQQQQVRAPATGTGHVRRRISRACDQCNQLRTKCDGQHPCAHCIEFGLGCEYARERKKRGKASRKDLAARAAAAAKSEGNKNGGVDSKQQHLGADASMDTDALEGTQQQQQQPLHLNTGSFGSMPPDYDRQQPDMGPYGAPNQPDMSAYPDLTGYPMPQNPTHSPPGYNDGGNSNGSQHNGGLGRFRVPSSPMGSGYTMGATTATTTTTTAATPSPGWGLGFNTPPPQAGQFVTSASAPAPISAPAPTMAPQMLRYPVLEPLLPHLGGVMPIGLACDLLEDYFSASSAAPMHPASPYVLGPVLRRRAVLHPTRPRRCKPGLLCSMLWVAAQTSDAAPLAGSPSARRRTCRRLLDLTVRLLNPLIHAPTAGSVGSASPSSSPIGGGPEGVVGLGGLGVVHEAAADGLTGEPGLFGAAGTLDDVLTYVHIATVVSASEYKGASIRWWNAAWSLARELRLGRELPPSMTGDAGADADAEADDDDNNNDDSDDVHGGRGGATATEEEREERRRAWWLLYMVDRHLALCYNRPLYLLDVECEGLRRPMDEEAWQGGQVGGEVDDGDDDDERYECRGDDIFGFFLPLMTILGEIVDIQQARNHPRLGDGFRPGPGEWDGQVASVSAHLETYSRSLEALEQQQRSPSAGEEGDRRTSTATSGSGSSSGMMQTGMAAAYGTHVAHVLHILLAGKWDPVSLLDDEDLWISTGGFVSATGHAVAGADAIARILDLDPGLELMPFFFGVYLLQGSFLLLLIADKLQGEASASVVGACETIVRAHEACVVTLSTEYQVRFGATARAPGMAWLQPGTRGVWMLDPGSMHWI